MPEAQDQSQQVNENKTASKNRKAESRAESKEEARNRYLQAREEMKSLLVELAKLHSEGKIGSTSMPEYKKIRRDFDAHLSSLPDQKLTSKLTLRLVKEFDNGTSALARFKQRITNLKQRSDVVSTPEIDPKPSKADPQPTPAPSDTIEPKKEIVNPKKVRKFFGYQDDYKEVRRDAEQLRKKMDSLKTKLVDPKEIEEIEKIVGQVGTHFSDFPRRDSVAQKDQEEHKETERRLIAAELKLTRLNQRMVRLLEKSGEKLPPYLVEYLSYKPVITRDEELGVTNSPVRMGKKEGELADWEKEKEEEIKKRQEIRDRVKGAAGTAENKDFQRAVFEEQIKEFEETKGKEIKETEDSLRDRDEKVESSLKKMGFSSAEINDEESAEAAPSTPDDTLLETKTILRKGTAKKKEKTPSVPPPEEEKPRASRVLTEEETQFKEFFETQSLENLHETDPRFKDLVEKRCLEHLKTKEGDWFSETFSGEVSPNGYLLNKDGDETLLASQMIGSGKDIDLIMSRIRASAWNKFRKLYPEDARAYEAKEKERSISREVETLPEEPVVTVEGKSSEPTPTVSAAPEPAERSIAGAIKRGFSGEKLGGGKTPDTAAAPEPVAVETKPPTIDTSQIIRTKTLEILHTLKDVQGLWIKQDGEWIHGQGFDWRVFLDGAGPQVRFEWTDEATNKRMSRTVPADEFLHWQREGKNTAETKKESSITIPEHLKKVPGIKTILELQNSGTEIWLKLDGTWKKGKIIDVDPAARVVFDFGVAPIEIPSFFRHQIKRELETSLDQYIAMLDRGEEVIIKNPFGGAGVSQEALEKVMPWDDELLTNAKLLPNGDIQILGLSHVQGRGSWAGKKSERYTRDAAPQTPEILSVEELLPPGPPPDEIEGPVEDQVDEDFGSGEVTEKKSKKIIDIPASIYERFLSREQAVEITTLFATDEDAAKEAFAQLFDAEVDNEQFLEQIGFYGYSFEEFSTIWSERSAGFFESQKQEALYEKEKVTEAVTGTLERAGDWIQTNAYERAKQMGRRFGYMAAAGLAAFGISTSAEADAEVVAGVTGGSVGLIRGIKTGVSKVKGWFTKKDIETEQKIAEKRKAKQEERMGSNKVQVAWVKKLEKRSPESFFGALAAYIRESSYAADNSTKPRSSAEIFANQALLRQNVLEEVARKLGEKEASGEATKDDRENRNEVRLDAALTGLYANEIEDFSKTLVTAIDAQPALIKMLQKINLFKSFNWVELAKSKSDPEKRSVWEQRLSVALQTIGGAAIGLALQSEPGVLRLVSRVIGGITVGALAGAELAKRKKRKEFKKDVSGMIEMLEDSLKSTRDAFTIEAGGYDRESLSNGARQIRMALNFGMIPGRSALWFRAHNILREIEVRLYTGQRDETADTLLKALENDQILQQEEQKKKLKKLAEVNTSYLILGGLAGAVLGQSVGEILGRHETEKYYTHPGTGIGAEPPVGDSHPVVSPENPQLKTETIPQTGKILPKASSELPVQPKELPAAVTKPVMPGGSEKIPVISESVPGEPKEVLSAGIKPAAPEAVVPPKSPDLELPRGVVKTYTLPEKGGTFYGGAKKLQDALSKENIAAIRAAHPEWNKLKEDRMLTQWRMEQSRISGQWFDEKAEHFTTRLHPGAEMKLVIGDNGYPKIELGSEHVQKLDHEIVKERVPAAEAVETTPEQKAIERAEANVKLFATEANRFITSEEAFVDVRPSEQLSLDEFKLPDGSFPQITHVEPLGTTARIDFENGKSVEVYPVPENSQPDFDSNTSYWNLEPKTASPGYHAPMPHDVETVPKANNGVPVAVETKPVAPVGRENVRSFASEFEHRGDTKPLLVELDGKQVQLAGVVMSPDTNLVNVTLPDGTVVAKYPELVTAIDGSGNTQTHWELRSPESVNYPAAGTSGERGGVGGSRAGEETVSKDRQKNSPPIEKPVASVAKGVVEEKTELKLDKVATQNGMLEFKYDINGKVIGTEIKGIQTGISPKNVMKDVFGTTKYPDSIPTGSDERMVFNTQLKELHIRDEAYQALVAQGGGATPEAEALKSQIEEDTEELMKRAGPNFKPKEQWVDRYDELKHIEPPKPEPAKPEVAAPEIKKVETIDDIPLPPKEIIERFDNAFDQNEIKALELYEKIKAAKEANDIVAFRQAVAEITQAYK